MMIEYIINSIGLAGQAIVDVYVSNKQQRCMQAPIKPKATPILLYVLLEDTKIDVIRKPTTIECGRENKYVFIGERAGTTKILFLTLLQVRVP